MNDNEDGIFDAVIVTIGTCGEPVNIDIDGSEIFERGGNDLNEHANGENGKHRKNIHKIIHSSQLDSLLENEGANVNTNTDSISNKKFVIIGSGASGVEACEWALAPPITSSNTGKSGSGEGEDTADVDVEAKAKRVIIVARDDKWIIPRNIIWDTMLSLQPFGREMWLRFG